MFTIALVAALSGSGQAPTPVNPVVLNPLANPAQPNPLSCQSCQVPQQQVPTIRKPIFTQTIAEGTVMPTTYASVRESVTAGNTILIAVGVPAPAGYTPVSNTPPEIKAGLYHCWNENGVPKMQVTAQAATFPIVRSTLDGLQTGGVSGAWNGLQFGVQNRTCKNGQCR